MKVIEYKAGDFEFEFYPSKGTHTKGELTTFMGDARVDLEIDLKKPDKQVSYIAYAREVYPEVFQNELGLKRALNELCGHVKDKVRIAEAKKAEEESDDEELAGDDHDVVDDHDVEELLWVPGVLNRYVESMAEVHEVYGDRAVMKATALGGLSAQLELLPDGKPVGTNVILIGESGRGKNYVTDAVASGLPDEWVYQYESASSKSFYYEAKENPDRFSHTWVYPNEAEATDLLVETLRPLLSGARAEHKTVNTDADGKSVFQEMRINGPITATIPTVRNKLDSQLQTRMLVVELEEFEGRVAEHSLKVSDTLLREYAAKEHAGTLRTWKAAFSKLTEVRRVVLPKRHENFKLSSGKASHGARLWRNFLSLMLTNAWLEQRNRKIEESNGAKAIVATAEDYRVAYEVFSNACERSVENLSTTHRNILDALYNLDEETKTKIRHTDGFSLRQIGERAGCSYETVRKHKSFLTQSLGLVRELDTGGLRLIKDAEPSWWKSGELLEGFPRPDEVERWWSDKLSERPQKLVDIVGTPTALDETPIATQKEASSEDVDDPVDTPTPTSTPKVVEELPIDKANTSSNGKMTTVSTGFETPNEKPQGEGDTSLGHYKLID